MSGRALTIVLWILQALVAAVFFMAGGSKLVGVMPAVDMYNQIGWGQWFRYATGMIEVGSAMMLLIPPLAIFGAALLICTMIGAIITHVTVLYTPPTGPVVLLLLSGVIAWLRRPTRIPA